MKNYLECGGLTPLLPLSPNKSAESQSKCQVEQSGVKPPHSKIGGSCCS